MLILVNKTITLSANSEIFLNIMIIATVNEYWLRDRDWKQASLVLMHIATCF